MKRWTALLVTLLLVLTGFSAVAEGKTVIEAIRPSSGMPAFEDDVIKAALDEALDIDIQLSALGSNSDYFTQLSVRLASGNAPDLFWVDSNNLKSLVNKNLVLDLTDYYGSELKTTFDWLGEDTMKLGLVNGKYYGIPNPNQFTYSTEWVRNDWLEAVGMMAPANIDELFAVAKAFTENDPDGNGANDTYGMSGNGFETFTPILSWFGIPSINDFYMKNGELTHSVYDPDMPKALEKIKEFVDAGVVDPEVFGAMTEQLLSSKAFQNQFGLLQIGWSMFQKDEHIEQMKAGDPDASWSQVEAMEGLYGKVDGKQEVGTTNHMFAIPASLENDPETLAKVFELLNYLCTEEGSRVVQYGVEGVHFEIQDGKVVKKEGSDWGEIGHVWLYQFTGRPDEFEYLSVRFPNQSDVIKFASVQPRIETYTGFVVIPEGYSLDDANNYITEELMKFAYGYRSLDEYPDFLDTLNTAFGFEEYYNQGIEAISAFVG